jgi:DNA-binding transcriptional MerR regulator
MSKQFTISQLAIAADVATTTIRYYERIGLMPPEDRSHGNYRLYSDDSLRKVKFIRAAQGIGFSLEDVKALLGVPDSSAASCRVVQPLIEQRLAEVGQRMKDLRHVQKVLKSALEKCRVTERDDCCHVIETLRATSRADGSPARRLRSSKRRIS